MRLYRCEIDGDLFFVLVAPRNDDLGALQFDDFGTTGLTFSKGRQRRQAANILWYARRAGYTITHVPLTHP